MSPRLEEESIPAQIALSDLQIPSLGPATMASRLRSSGAHYIEDHERVLAYPDEQSNQSYIDKDQPLPSFERAGPRKKVFFDPKSLTAGIVTCGGLCPGLNDVVRSIYFTLHFGYGVRSVLGFRYGYNGLSDNPLDAPWDLNPDVVSRIHEHGGTILGTSRGPQDLKIMVNTLKKRGVGILFVIGGDGTLRGASALAEEVERQKLPISIIGIPKTIDNDLMWTARSFGFTTAVEEARRAISSAHSEAKGAWNGIGLVKVMGRHAGFIAAHSTLANPDVNFCLVPEVPFKLKGPNGFLATLERRLDRKRHAVIVVAEGAGQDLIQDQGKGKKDKSGNVLLKDIGLFLKQTIKDYFAKEKKEISVKYIDPSYMIRSLPANAIDSELCLALGQNAVHAGMAGKTRMAVGIWNQIFTHIPISLMVGKKRQLDPRGMEWPRVLEATGQPNFS